MPCSNGFQRFKQNCFKKTFGDKHSSPIFAPATEKEQNFSSKFFEDEMNEKQVFKNKFGT